MCSSVILACATRDSALALLPNLLFTPLFLLVFSGVFCSIYSSWPFPTRATPNDRYWDQHQDWAQQLLKVIKGAWPAGGWPDLLEYVALNLGVRPTAVALPNVRNPDIYLDFVNRMLDFAVCPYLSRHPLAAAAGVSGKTRALDRIQEEIRGGHRNQARFRVNLIDEIGIIPL